MNLTETERNRFATYLEQEAKTDEEMAIQCEKLGVSPMVKKLKIEAMAERIVAQKLRSTYEEILEG